MRQINKNIIIKQEFVKVLPTGGQIESNQKAQEHLSLHLYAALLHEKAWNRRMTL